jgi:PIN domain nuclease of toxin-antitoxin system
VEQKESRALARLHRRPVDRDLVAVAHIEGTVYATIDGDIFRDPALRVARE